MTRLLILIDGSAVAYRGYFAFIRNPLRNSRGENTSGIYAFTNSLMKLLDQTSPSHIACVFDSKVPTARHSVYGQYKSTRLKMPDELAASLPAIKDVLDGFRIRTIEMEGYEADDIIGTLAQKAAARGFEVGMFTGDKDFFQLVDEKIKLIHPKTFEWFDRDAVIKKVGVPPEKIVDWLGLMGDASDNVPGVPGVGEKTAVKLIQEFGDLEGVLRSADRIPQKKLSEAIRANAEQARLSQSLVTIQLDVPVELNEEELALQEPDTRKLARLFERLEFKSLYEKFASSTKEIVEAEQVIVGNENYKSVDSLEQLGGVLAEAQKERQLAISIVPSTQVAIDTVLAGLSLAVHKGEAFYVPLHHHEPANNLPLEQVLPRIGGLLDAGVKIVGHDLKFIRHVFANHGVRFDRYASDVMVAAYLMNPSKRSYDVDLLVSEHFNHRIMPLAELIRRTQTAESGSKEMLAQGAPLAEIAASAGEHADYVLRLAGLFEKELAQLKLDRLFYDLEMPLIEVLCDMERTGVAIDVEFLQELSRVYGQKMAEIEDQIFVEAGQQFNVNSPQQLRTILFDKLLLPSSKKTAKGGEKSTDVGVLQQLALSHPLPALVLAYRQLQKLKSTYIDALPRMINSRTDRVHTSFNQTMTSTGRLSSSDPNLQNVPIRTEEGREIRKAFIARPGFNILSADYSQIELRLMAHFSQDQALIESFRRGEDIHKRTAAEVFGVKMDDVTPAQRRVAKTANFAIIYGVSAYGLSQQSEMSVKEAQAFINTYFDRYPGVKRYTEELVMRARERGYVETLLKRRRYLPDINSKQRQAREFAERTAINTPIQGTAADLIKLAMIKIAYGLKGKQSKMILQVHDELVFEQAVTEREEVRKLVKEQMEGVLELAVPIAVTLDEGDNWLEAH